MTCKDCKHRRKCLKENKAPSDQTFCGEFRPRHKPRSVDYKGFIATQGPATAKIPAENGKITVSYYNLVIVARRDGTSTRAAFNFNRYFSQRQLKRLIDDIRRYKNI